MFDLSLLRFSLFEPGLYVGTFAAPVLCALLVAEHLWHWETPKRGQFALVGVWALAGAIALIVTGQHSAIAIAGIGILLSFISRRLFREYYVTGQMMLAAIGPMVLCGLGWSLSFLDSLPLSTVSRSLLIMNIWGMLLTSGLGFALILPAQAYLYRKRWYRPRFPLDSDLLESEPKVSFHVPCYAEPPEVVCNTLKSLSQIHYSNYEVLVIDNNTKDPALWQPVQHYCDRLGHRFRFFHVDPLSGAKAGALNFALKETVSDAELIAVIDADYQVQPDFLERLVGYFQDPNLGYVQTPHDYRNWQGNAYQEACYWEYMLYFRLHLSCLNEWMASHIIGTMCITRRAALEEAGGWAEWCLTEDSECAVRIHALGYSSLFINHTFGRGLIPENFRHYKKQRLRWMIGPIQQIQKHWRLYLPQPFGKPSFLTGWQQVVETAHSIGGLRPVMILLGLPMMFTTIGSLIYHQEVVPIPQMFWVMAMIGTPVGLVHIWLTFYLLGCRSVRGMLGATVASMSLSYIKILGAFKGLSFWKELPWIRTHKFKVLPNRWAALQTISMELVLALVFLAVGGAIAPFASVAPPDLLLFVALGFVSQAIAFLMAPVMAFLAEHQLSRSRPRDLVSNSNALMPNPMRKI